MSDFPGINPGASVAEALRSAPLDALENRILTGHALQLTRIQLITQSERILSDQEAARLNALLRRRLQGEPIAYIVGEREFFGLAMHVTPDVLIPVPIPNCWWNWRWSVCRGRAGRSTWAPAPAPSQWPLRTRGRMSP